MWSVVFIEWFSFLFQIPLNFQFSIVQAIITDLRDIWDLPTNYHQAYIFHNLNLQDGLGFPS